MFFSVFFFNWDSALNTLCMGIKSRFHVLAFEHIKASVV